MRITALRFPLPMEPVGLHLPAQLGPVVVSDGPAAWSWEASDPALPIDTFASPDAVEVPEWGLDHVVLTTPDLDGTTSALVEIGCDLRRHGRTARGGSAAFLLAGTLIEVIEVADAARPTLSGIALETDLSLEDLAAQWRTAGFEVADPHPAVQEGRMIMSVRGHRLAVMTRR